MKKKESILGMAFFGPALVLLTLFLFLPMVLTLVFSFTDYFALNPDMTHFVGLENYINIFKDELFVKSFFNTVKFVLIIVPCQCIGALVLALAINKVTHCKKYFKVAFFIPVVMSLAVVSTLWMDIYSPEGILNTLLAHLGISAQPFIHSAKQALPSSKIKSLSIRLSCSVRHAKFHCITCLHLIRKFLTDNVVAKMPFLNEFTPDASLTKSSQDI